MSPWDDAYAVVIVGAVGVAEVTAGDYQASGVVVNADGC